MIKIHLTECQFIIIKKFVTTQNHILFLYGVYAIVEQTEFMYDTNSKGIEINIVRTTPQHTLLHSDN